jgi:hypothetical protein
MASSTGLAVGQSKAASALSTDETTDNALNDIPASHPDWLGLTRAIAGCVFDRERESASGLSRLVSTAATDDIRDRFSQHLNPFFWPSQEVLYRIVQLMVSVAAMLRRDADVSISYLGTQLVQNRVFLPTPDEDPVSRLRREDLIFVALGWMTNLFEPIPSSAPSGNGATLTVNAEHATCFEKSSISSDLTSRPLAEMIRHFGDLLPTRQHRGGIHRGSWGSVHEADAASVDTLHVASINVASLQQTGNIKIEWTGCFTSHLDFDPGRLDAISGSVTPVLKIFRHPSLCYQHAPPSSILHR